MALSRAKISKLVQKAMVTLGDIPLKITYVSVTVGAYDPSSDTVATTTVSRSNVTAVNTKLKEQEIDWFPADINTQRILIAALDLPNIVPKVDDYVLIDSVRWEVKRVNIVPGGSLYIVFIQEP